LAARRALVAEQQLTSAHDAATAALTVQLAARDRQLAELQQELAHLRASSDAARRQQAAARSVVDPALSVMPAAAPLLEVGTYDCLRLLGKGAFGKVYQARAKGSVAVKLIPLEGLSPRDQTAAHREVTALRALVHPGVVAVVDGFVDAASTLCIAMEYCDGGTLDAAITERASLQERFSDDELALCLAQLALGLEHMHAQGFVHRDVKPANIFYTAHKRRVVLGDLGLARLVEASTAGTTRALAGTTLFAAPEVFKGQTREPKSDVWALGCTLWAMGAMTREGPFAAETPNAVMWNVATGTPAPLPELAAGLQTAIAGMLAKEVADRLSSAGVAKLAVLQAGTVPARLVGCASDAQLAALDAQVERLGL